MTAAIVLSAGLGTRLRPLSDWRAKPLVPVGDRPLLEHIVEALRRGGIDRIVVNAHHRLTEMRDAVRRAGATLSEEADLLGTAGGVARAATLLGEGDVVVWNGDIVADLDLRALVASHASDATLAIAPRPLGEGNVGVDASGHIVRLRQETARAGEVRGGDFLGIHVLGARLRGSLPERGCLVGDVYLPALRGGASLGIFAHRGAWSDVGTPASYLAANLAWLPPGESWIAEGAAIAEGAVVERSLVGTGAVVLADVRGSVVWPGARVTTSVTDAIVAPEGIVRV